MGCGQVIGLTLPSGRGLLRRLPLRGGMMGRVGTTPRARYSRRRRFRIAVVGVSVVVAVVGSVLLVTRDSSEKTTTLGVMETLHVAGHPGAVVAGPDALWVALSGDSRESAGNERILRLDLATGAQAPSVELGGKVSHLAHAGDRMIASVQHTSGLAELAILDWRTGAVLTRHWYDGPVDQTVLRGNELWALKARPGTLLRLDPQTLDEISAPLPLSPGRTPALASGGGYLWATAADTGEVLRIDPATHAIKRAHVGGLPVGIVVTGGSVWVADRENGKVVRLDPGSLLPVGKPIGVGARPSWLAAAAGSLFVTDQDDGTVARIDVHSGKKIGLPIRVGPSTNRRPRPLGCARSGVRLGEQLRIEHARPHRVNGRLPRRHDHGAPHAYERPAPGRQGHERGPGGYRLLHDIGGRLGRGQGQGLPDGEDAPDHISLRHLGHPGDDHVRQQNRHERRHVPLDDHLRHRRVQEPAR